MARYSVRAGKSGDAQEDGLHGLAPAKGVTAGITSTSNDHSSSACSGGGLIKVKGLAVIHRLTTAGTGLDKTTGLN
ncbi:hypothetical protein RRG08_032243 [Elysia crispata]|uniref:Uncharacterized protein n=1 Tax=Elysia crispata TaxID=231223 RepID=A0AAE1B116_9GAST|nr:hypothetical protein RRG08_032243 [Elysia crispata]